MFDKHSLISNLPQKPLMIRLVGDTDKLNNQSVLGVFGIFTNKLFANFATVLDQQFELVINNESISDITKDNTDVIAFSLNNVRTVSIRPSYQLNLDERLGRFTIGSYYDSSQEIISYFQDILQLAIAPYTGNVNSIAIDYDSSNKKFYSYCQQVNGENVYLTGLDNHDEVLYPPENTKTVIDQSEFVPILQLPRLYANRNLIEDFRYSVYYKSVNGKTLPQLQEQVKRCFPDPKAIVVINYARYVNYYDQIMDIGTNIPLLNWDQFWTTDSNNILPIPLIDENISSGLIEVEISAIENAKLTLPITCDWEQDVTGPSFSKTIDVYVTTTTTAIKSAILEQIPLYFDISCSLIGNSGSSLSSVTDETSGVKIDLFYEEFITPDHQANHIVHLSGTIMDELSRVIVGSTTVHVRCKGTITSQLENFSFEAKYTRVPDGNTTFKNECIEFVLKYDDNVGWYVGETCPAYWGLKTTAETNNQNGRVKCDIHITPSNPTICPIVKNHYINQIYYFEDIVTDYSISASFDYQKPATVTISTDPNLFVGHENDTTWNQLPAAFRNIINRNWSMIVKETDWEKW